MLLLCSDNVNLFAWIYLPIIAFVEYILVLGLVMIFSALTVYLRDLEHILGIVTMAWQFLSPVMYGVDMVPKEYLYIFNLNPMTPVIVAYRDILYYGRIPEIDTLAQALGFGLLFCILGFFIFDKLKRRFAEEL